MKCKVGIRTKRACDATWLQCLLCKLGIKDVSEAVYRGVIQEDKKRFLAAEVKDKTGEVLGPVVSKPETIPGRPVRRFGQELKEKVEASRNDDIVITSSGPGQDTTEVRMPNPLPPPIDKKTREVGP